LRIAILGAAGQTGKELITEGLRRRHEIIALARQPEKIESVDARVTKRKADAFDRASVIDGLKDAEAVITTVGKKDLRDPRINLNTVGHRHVLDGMKVQGIRRLIVISSFGAAQGVRRKGIRRKIYLYLRRKYYGDMHDMEGLVLADRTINSTIVRAPMLGNGPVEGRYEVVAGNVLPVGLHISRADLVRFIFDVLDQRQYPGTIVALANPPG
jgi:nucleoside-diphosphate-sugar epimerase